MSLQNVERFKVRLFCHLVRCLVGQGGGGGEVPSWMLQSPLQFGLRHILTGTFQICNTWLSGSHLHPVSHTDLQKYQNNLVTSNLPSRWVKNSGHCFDIKRIMETARWKQRFVWTITVKLEFYNFSTFSIENQTNDSKEASEYTWRT